MSDLLDQWGLSAGELLLAGALALLVLGVVVTWFCTGGMRRELFLTAVVLFGLGVAVCGPLLYFVSTLDWERHPILLVGTASAVVAVFGWFITYMLRLFEHRTEEQRLERRVLLALREEIFIVFEQLERINILRSAEMEKAKIENGGNSAGTRYTPFIPQISAATVFNGVALDLPRVSTAALQPIVRFYTAHSDLRAFLDDLARPEFASLSSQQRARAMDRLAKHRELTLIWAMRALISTNRLVGVKRAEAAPERSGNNPEFTV